MTCSDLQVRICKAVVYSLIKKACNMDFVLYLFIAHAKLVPLIPLGRKYLHLNNILFGIYIMTGPAISSNASTNDFVI